MAHCPPVVERVFDRRVRTAPRARDVEACTTVPVFGLSVAPFTTEDTLRRVADLVESGEPSYFITANLNFAMHAHKDARVRAIARDADFVVADGLPLVWWARLSGRPLPERVAGSDLVFAISAQAARLGHRLFLLGAEPGVASAAALQLEGRYPGLRVVGVESPPFHPPTPADHRALLERIGDARPDILFVAMGQPKGELWISENLYDLAVPLVVQVGASLDFVAGRVRRAPRIVQRLGLEWLFRLVQEPRRLVGRYAANGWFLVGQLPLLWSVRCRRCRHDSVTGSL